MTKEDELKNIKKQLNYHKELLDNFYNSLNQEKSLSDIKATTYLRLREEAECIASLSYLVTYLMLNRE